MNLNNSYEDKNLAESYSTMEFKNTYYVAYRDLPKIIKKYVSGKNAIDFGCGGGRSTRFLKKLGFSTLGLDNSDSMIKTVMRLDPSGQYTLIKNDDFSVINDKHDLILAIFTFDNIANGSKIKIFKGLKKLLNRGGKIIILVSTPEIYTNEWLSFTTKVFTHNKTAKCGDIVNTIIIDIKDRSPIDDILCPDDHYQFIFNESGLKVIDIHKPLGKNSEPFDWISEDKTPPWCIYVLASSTNCKRGDG